MRVLVVVLLIAGCPTRRERIDLAAAVRSGDVAAVRALCARGANPNVASGDNGWPLLMRAVHKNQLGMAAALLDAGAEPNAANADGYTALMMAAGYGNDEMVSLLLRRGASPKLKDLHGSTAIDYALTGVTDIDRFTFFRCQTGSVALLKPSSPPPLASSRRWASIKGCG